MDYTPIRNRLMELKKKAGLDAFEFCKIYAPEKCSTESNAKNYISALSTGRNYPDEKHGPLLPDLEHLMNIVNSDSFPDVTLNYLIYGDETPTKEIEKLDLDPEHWTLADFCVFLGNLIDKYPYLQFEKSVPQDIPITVNGDDLTEKQYNFVIKVPEYDTLSNDSYDIGTALGIFVSEYEKIKDIPSETAQKVLRKQIIDSVIADKRFSETSLTANGRDSFISYGDNGPEVEGLNIN